MIATKQQFYRLYERGAFGNRLRTFPSLHDLDVSGYRGNVTVRSHTAAGHCAYGVPACDARVVALQWGDGLVSANESAPDDRLVIQGEVMRNAGGLSLRYSTEKTNMRAAMANHAATADGLLAANILRGVMDPASYDDLNVLLDAHTDAVVEFGVYDGAVGQVPGRNTVFWEVRNY